MSTKKQEMTRAWAGTAWNVAAWIVAAEVVLSLPAGARADYTFADWASDQGYSPGDAMPASVYAYTSAIDDLGGIGDYNWTATPTIVLYLDDNRISSIESGAFSGLTKLEWLNLAGNQISSIESGDFSGLTNLASLTLDDNQISSIESGAFSGLTNLAWLTLGDNRISSIESGAFSGLTNLWELHLEANRILSIELGYFSGLMNLRQLELEENQISSIESGALSGLTNLASLTLDDNQISSIESGDFSCLTNLKELYLEENQISSIESGAFSGLTKLDELDLSYNALLTKLNLAGADFSSLEEHFSVKGNTNTASVSLKNTVLNQRALAVLFDGGGTGNIGIGELPGIRELDLSGVDFAEVTDLAPLYAMDDLTDLWLVDVLNLDAVQLDVMLDELETIEGTDIEGILYMMQADFDALNTAGGLLAAWNAEPGHHVQIIPEPATLVLLAVACLWLLPWLRRRASPRQAT